MHISEGILSGSVLIAGWAGTCALTAVGLKKTDKSKIVRTALAASVFFLASLVNVRVGPTSTHLSLLAPMGLVLGWGVFPAVLTALLLQAVLFGFGGLLVLGVNTFVMGTAALSAYLLFGKIIRRTTSRGALGGILFDAGFVPVMIGALLVAACLAFTDYNFLTAVKVLVAAHLPLANIEGAVTIFLITLLKNFAPEFLA